MPEPHKNSSYVEKYARPGGMVGMISTRNLAVAAAVSCGVMAAAAADAEARQYWHGCAPPAFNHHGLPYGAGTTIVDSTYAGAGCNGGTGNGTPCAGFTANNGTNIYQCPTGSTRRLTESYTVSASPPWRVFVNLCQKCGANRSHITSGNSFVY